VPFDQRGLNCCVSATVVACFEILDFYQHRARRHELSVLFNYFTARKRSGRLTTDPEAELTFQDGFEAARTLGLAPADLHPADATRASARKSPSEEARDAAEAYRDWHRKPDKLLVYRRLTSGRGVDAIRRCLEARHPVALGIWLTDAYKDLDADSPVLAPSDGRSSLLHAVTVVGYDNRKADADGNAVGALRIRDSRGVDFGECGYWWLPYPLCESLAYQAWTLRYEEDDW